MVVRSWGEGVVRGTGSEVVVGVGGGEARPGGQLKPL